MLLQDILNEKGTAVYTIRPDATLQDVVYRLVHHKVGSLVVTGDGDPEGDVVGIITERDILRACASERGPLSSIPVSDVMSTRLHTGAPDGTMEDAMGLMTDNRIRHLPVLAQGKLAGIVSIGDVVKAQHDHLAMENRFMKDYIRG